MDMLGRLREGMKRRDSAVISEYDANFYIKPEDINKVKEVSTKNKVSEKKEYMSTGAVGKKRGARTKQSRGVDFSGRGRPKKGFEVKEEGRYLDAVREAQELEGRGRKPGYSYQTEFQTALESDKEAVLYGIVKYRCRKCDKVESIYCEVGVEDSNCKPSPYEIECPHCGDVMVEVGCCKKLKKVIKAEVGMKYFADFPKYERGQLVVKVDKNVESKEE